MWLIVVSSLCLVVVVQKVNAQLSFDFGRICYTKNDNRAGFCIAARDCSMFDDYTRLLPDSRARRVIKEHKCSIFTTRIDRNTQVCCPNEILEPIFEHIARNTLPKRGHCDASLSNYIKNGALSHIYEFPWMVQIEYRNTIDNTTEVRCAGSIITKDHVVTAAHCVDPFLHPHHKAVGILLGEWNIQENSDCEELLGCNDPSVFISISSIVQHELFFYDEREQAKNDIALIRLRRSIRRFTIYIKPICLPYEKRYRNLVYQNQKLMIAGFGQTSDGGERSVIKKVATVRAVGDYECRSEYRRAAIDDRICAQGEEGTDACKGDSGGSLVQFHPQEEFWQFVGIVSLGPPCTNQSTIPGTYTRVDKHVEWILSKLRYKQF